MSGGKGGSQTTQVEIPQWLSTAAQANLAQGKEVSRIGYIPYYGPDVAGMGQGQIAAAANTNQFAKAFGMQGAAPSSLGDPTEFAGGLQAYSSGGLYDQAVAELKARRPLQYNQITSGRFFNPTGEDSNTVNQGSNNGNQGGNDSSNNSSIVYFGGVQYDLADEEQRRRYYIATQSGNSPDNPNFGITNVNAYSGNQGNENPTNVVQTNGNSNTPLDINNPNITFFNGTPYDLSDPNQLQAYYIATGASNFSPDSPTSSGADNAAQQTTYTAQGLLSTMKQMPDWKTMSAEQKIDKYIQGAKLNNIAAEDIAAATGYDINTVNKYM